MPQAGTPVKITIEIHIDRDGNKEDYELMVFGHYYKKNKTSYLIYDEFMENDGKVHTVVKYIEEEKPYIQLTRKGSLNMTLFFKNKELVSGSYKTNAGVFTVETSTNTLQYAWDEIKKQGTMNIKYDFYMEHMNVGSYQMKFTFKEENEI